MIGTESISRVTGTLRAGLFGTKESFIPIRDAALPDDGVTYRWARAR